MIAFKRSSENPILIPDQNGSWEAEATFNPSVIKEKELYRLLYRAMSSIQQYDGIHLPLSSIGYAESEDGIHFNNRHQLITPKYAWEYFGCEDPRMTKLGKKYYIFYTALSTYPFSPNGIKEGVAITEDFITFDKYQVTPFNAKAMALFPEKIDGKMVAILTCHSDLPPPKIALAFFEEESEIWSARYWDDWYKNLDFHVIPLLRSLKDHMEVGAPPVKTSKGWLLIYSYIENYHSANKIFGIEAVLLDLHNPLKVIGRTKNLMVPEESYEKQGQVQNIVFPTAAIIEDDQLRIYYGAADTYGCTATTPLNDLLEELTKKNPVKFIESEKITNGFKRYNNNPIIKPRFELFWEEKGTLNPTVFQEKNGVHIMYRAFSKDETSTLGYAFSKDGLHIDERFPYPIYVPREEFEIKKHPGFSGCEDPRITVIGKTLFMLYTAYNGDIPRVAMTQIAVNDFLKQKWNWSKPRVISAPGIKDKNACIFPKLIDEQYIILHRNDRCIFIDFIDKKTFLEGDEFLSKDYLLMRPRAEKWDNIKIGAAAAPIETSKGWLLFYHGYSDPGAFYKVGAVLLDLKDPRKVIARTDTPLIEPEMDYETQGFVHNVVFPCGAIVIDDLVYLYYGGGDFVIGVATMPLEKIIGTLISIE